MSRMRSVFGPAVVLSGLAMFTAGHGPFGGEIEHPWKETHIGALDGRAWAGLVLAPQRDAAFALRFAFERNGRTIDGEDLFYMVSEVGPHSPDGLYARVRFDLGLPVLSAEAKSETPVYIKPSDRNDTATLEWSRVDERTAVGRMSAPRDAAIRLIQYFPWDFKGRYSLAAEDSVRGEATSAKPWRCLLWTHRAGEFSASAGGETSSLAFPPQKGQSVYFVAVVGEETAPIDRAIYRYKNTRTIDRL
ncbi:MAG: hypothetical protein FJY82_00895, partial [Candidatus Aminicenantes bacterium]|nr:hypothetical protein [Candidatus Aminicenantes bacterium]